MAADNETIAAVFDELADLHEIEGDNPFRVRAYRNAARTLRGLGREAAQLLAAGEDLTRLPGIGRELAAKIAEIVATGTCAALERARARVPHGLVELLHVPGLGPVRVRTLHRALGIDSPEALAEAARAGRLRALPGFGERLEARILEALQARLDQARRFPLHKVEPVVARLLAYLRHTPGVARVEPAGSFRRRRDTVGDLDVLAVAADGAAVGDRLAAWEETAEVLSRGPTRASIVHRDGIQVDLRVVPLESFGAAWHYFTGAKAHNIAVRRMGQARGLKINEYGVFRGGERIAGVDEASVYAAVALPWIPPELREDRGELEAARQGALPRLVERADLRGDLHCHTTASDGRDDLEAMARAAQARGLEYLAITEHSRRLRIARGLDERGLLRHFTAIDELNARLEGITLLKGVEVDILEDGRLDLPDRVLERCEVVVAAVHSAFGLDAGRQTRRILRALDHPLVHVLAHPTGRLLGRRPPYAVDLAAVIRRAARNGVWLELNANPWRLDLDDVHCRMARDEGARIALSSDAHAAAELDHLRHGIDQARRGWLEARDVVNTRPLEALRPLLAARR
ncbi:DNA polymerase/3'-5' exonuclease PolX [Inmirania thermothiophila]|uniref:DNA polymerase beta n=1 Tax=Inmirania thermothiophila TaxID=1750597 RepID=A0A3N1Y0M5_9GAMM|nr:DNA polymerase/3'-5' exonuclease PolX [Inmirania thermothiophila]ROR32395.1 DNA polymerase (family 10) [Inmirania thermothiophila]